MTTERFKVGDLVAAYPPGTQVGAYNRRIQCAMIVAVDGWKRTRKTYRRSSGMGVTSSVKHLTHAPKHKGTYAVAWGNVDTSRTDFPWTPDIIEDKHIRCSWDEYAAGRAQRRDAYSLKTRRAEVNRVKGLDLWKRARAIGLFEDDPDSPEPSTGQWRDGEITFSFKDAHRLMHVFEVAMGCGGHRLEEQVLSGWEETSKGAWVHPVFTNLYIEQEPGGYVSPYHAVDASPVSDNGRGQVYASLESCLQDLYDHPELWLDL